MTDEPKKYQRKHPPKRRGQLLSLWIPFALRDAIKVEMYERGSLTLTAEVTALLEEAIEARRKKKASEAGSA